MSRFPVSGLLPIHNGEKWIASNLPNILSSLSAQDELIVIDDGSTDSTFEAITKFAKEDSRIALHRSTHLGLVRSLNLGLNLAKNSWVARFDIDDRYTASRIDQQINLAIGDASAGVVFSDYRVWRNGTEFRGRIPSPLFPLQTKLSLVNSQRTPHPSALINRDLVISVGGYRQEEFPAEDLGLWIRLSQVSNLVSIENVGLDYNRHVNSISNSRRKQVVEKRNSLIQTIRFSQTQKKALLSDLDSLFADYSGTSFENLRKFLFGYDYLTWLKITQDLDFLRNRNLLRIKIGSKQSRTTLSADLLKFGGRLLQRRFERNF